MTPIAYMFLGITIILLITIILVHTHHKSRNSALHAEIERLSHLLQRSLEDKLTLSDFQANSEICEATIHGSIIHIFAESFANLFKGLNTKNYLQVSFLDRRDGEKYILTMQRQNGQSPAEKNTTLQQHLRELHEALTDSEQINNLCDKQRSLIHKCMELQG